MSDKIIEYGESEKKSGLSPKMTDPMCKKKNVDFTDFAYREAVNRLKYLLAESYTTSKMTYHRPSDCDDSDYQSTAERPVLSEISKYFPQSSALTQYNTRRLVEYPVMTKENFPLGLKPSYSTSSLQQSEIAQITDVNPPPQELMNFIERQEHYIEQLEKESQFCREELANLLSKVKNVITENETLTDKAKVGLTRTFLSNMDSSESDENDNVDSKSLSMKYTSCNMGPIGPNIVFESRISELEAQLAQSAIDYKRLNEENENNKRKIAMGVGESGSADIYRKQIDNLQREKIAQDEIIRKLQTQINEMKEADSFSKSQRVRDFNEQVVFERTQADIEIRRLKDELERQHERVREIQNEMARRIADERTNAERRYNYQVDQLGGDLTCQWEQASKLQIELERQKRIESDYKRDLMQKNSQIDELKAEIKSKTSSWLSDVAQMNAEKQSLEQEITSLRMQLERAERQSKVETSRLNAEVNSLRQRLDRSDGDLLHARRENLRLSDQISALEKEITLGEIGREPRPKEMSKIISDMEMKHANTVSELEGMIHDQRQLMEKLTSECKSLTQKLEDTSLKHKNNTQILRQTNKELMERLRQIWTSYKDINPLFRNGKGPMNTSSDSEALNHTEKRSTYKRKVTSKENSNIKDEKTEQWLMSLSHPQLIETPQSEATLNSKIMAECQWNSQEELNTNPQFTETSTPLKEWKSKRPETPLQMSRNVSQIYQDPEADRVYSRNMAEVHHEKEVEPEETTRLRLKEEMKRELEEWSCSRSMMEQVNWDNLAERRQQWSTPVGEIIRRLEGKSQEILSSLSTMQPMDSSHQCMINTNPNNTSSSNQIMEYNMGLSNTNKTNMIPVSTYSTPEMAMTNNQLSHILNPQQYMKHQPRLQQVPQASPPRKLLCSEQQQEESKCSKSMQNRIRALQMWGIQIPDNSHQANYCQNSLPRQWPQHQRQEALEECQMAQNSLNSDSPEKCYMPDDGFRISISSPSLFECSTSSSSSAHSPIPTVQQRM
ncbi:serologically defined colon cancer antigen 8 homolog isoform X2 [Phlebotomus papatasi]|uniref:serologically defined colon cancer antigen 8 homolog isoform X2 n=1 Tax=Phlebotomus papatasi TaxID=29031 RepID=UPI00248358FC|nr:serologically defined colon cancer antigen 8 homolog isoform X2 [Phlebotomus papatasi]